MLTSIRAADLIQISPFVCTHLFVCGWVCVYFSVVLSHVSLHIHHRSQDTEQVPPHEDASWCPWEPWHLPPAPPPAPNLQPPTPSRDYSVLRPSHFHFKNIIKGPTQDVTFGGLLLSLSKCSSDSSKLLHAPLACSFSWLSGRLRYRRTTVKPLLVARASGYVHFRAITNKMSTNI